MRVSICVGNYATTPYYIAGLELPVNSMEELSFALKENAFLLDVSVMRDELVEWIDRECGLQSLAGELYKLIHRQGSLSAFVIMILEYVGFYESADIRDVEQILKKGAGLSIIERRKSQIDYLVRQKRYAAAIRGYDNLLDKWTEMENAGNELPAAKVRGAILHNKAVALAGMMFYGGSAECFKEAYETDGGLAHFQGYLAAKRMELSEGEYISFAAEQSQGYKYTLELEKKMERLTEDWKIQPEFQRLLEIREWRRTGDRQLYYDGNDEIIQELKSGYCSSVGE